MKRKLMAIALTLCMVLTMMPVAFAAETTASSLPTASADGVISLDKDYDLSATGWTVEGNVILDLAGHSLKVANTDAGNIDVPSGASLTLKDSAPNSTGKIYTETDYSSAATGYGIIVVNGGSFTMESGYIGAVRDNATNKGQFALMVQSGGSITIKGGKVEAGWYAITGNGTDQESQSTINVTGGELVSTADYALYLPHNCVTTISADTVVDGAAGAIAMRAGTLNVKGGTLASKGTGNTGSYGDGTGGMSNAAINIGDGNAKLYNDVTVAIEAGTFTASNPAVSLKVVNNDTHKADVTITGGTFANDVSDYIPADYICEESDSNWVVKEATGLATNVATDNSSAVTVTVTGVVPSTSQTVTDDDGLNTSTPTAATINATTAGEKAANATISIPAATAATMTAKSGYELTIEADAATVVLDKNAMEAVQSAAAGNTAAEGEDITVEISSSTTTINDSSVSVYSVTVKAGEEEILSESEAPENAKITITVPAPENAEKVYVWLMNNDNNTWKKVSQVGDVLTPDAAGKVTFTTPHLSAYATFTTEQGGDYEASYTSNDGVKYDTLSNALTNGTTVTLLKDMTLSSTVAEGKTLVVPEGKTLTVSDVGTVAGSAGTIRVEAGGAVKVGDVEMIGGGDANINLTEGYIGLSMKENKLDLNFVGAKAEIPSSKRWTMALTVAADQTVPMTATLDSDTTLTVNGTGGTADNQDDGFRVANNAVLTNNGQIEVNGVMSVSSAGEVAGNGTITVNADGVLGVKTGDGSTGKLSNGVTVSGVMFYDGTATNENLGTVTLASGGKVYSQASITVGNDKRDLGDKTYAGTEYSYAWEYYKASSGGSGGGSSTPTYAVSAPSAANGKVTASPANASKGAKVTLTVTPDKGYVLDTLTVTDKDGKEVPVTKTADGKYTFTMPDGKVDVKATFKAEEQKPATGFVDVPSDAYYADAVTWAVEKGITNGITETTFGPNGACTRAHMVTFLWRAAGCPEPTGTANAFTDVDMNAYYGKAVLWAIEKGITNGVDTDKFGPDQTCTRAQMATFLYRYAASPAVSGDGGFVDVPTDAYYADAVAWAAANKVTNGTGNNTYSPNMDCTRAQIVTFLYRYMAD